MQLCGHCLLTLKNVVSVGKPASVKRNVFKPASRREEGTFLHIYINKHVIAFQAPLFVAC